MNTSTWSDIVYYLEGSCNTLHEALEAFNMTELENDDTFLSFLDDQIFYCIQCGWWCPKDEENIVAGEQMCDCCYL
jgi:hypothetical protein